MAPFRRGAHVTPRVEVERRADGAILLTNPYPLVTPPVNVIAPFRRWAVEAPDRIWLAERTEPEAGWRTVTYGAANEAVRRIAEGLIARGLCGQDAPLMILSGNSVDHALMTYGAILAGMPAAPVSRGYSTMSSDFDKLKYVFDLVKPKAIFADDMPIYEKALAALDLTGVQLFHSRRAFSGGSTDIAALQETPSGAVADAAYTRLRFDDVAKFLFTSGSTGMPKAAMNTHRQMCTNAAMIRSTLENPDNAPPAVTLTWLPWSHTFGGNSILNINTVWGGTIYLDNGSPTPAGFAETLRNLREISPTAYSNVPAGWTMLVAELEKDEALARTFFHRLKQMAYGGAALGQEIGDRIQTVAARVTGERLPFSSGYGSTETGPSIMNVHWSTERMGLIGLPLPGVVVKLVPVGGKLEVRAKGDTITPGYFGRPDLTAKAFDEEGYYCLGDAAKFVDPEDPAKGFVFDGRVVEDFKLDTGTFVNAGRLRIQAIDAGGGLIQDALVAGQNRAFVAILAWPDLAACRDLVGEDLSADDLVRHPKVLDALAAALSRHNAANPGSSTQIRRALLMTEPPSFDAGEITDKGSINQALSLARRSVLVERLYAEPVGPAVVPV
ncbi:2-succinylbenzoate--CoA ligase [Alphaproteobacteria bacterium SO-S41]|nr:2-succinylbenzoate--CoA ligase [Alphaproteobacteria bacterium SO-S41]